MSLPIDPVFLVIPLTGIVAAAAFVLYDTWLTARSLPPWHDDPGRRRCRYCHWGQAYLAQESVRREGDDVVEVRCFACASCGLPQWTVERIPLVISH
jgi:hypothetical protein